MKINSSNKDEKLEIDLKTIMKYISPNISKKNIESIKIVEVGEYFILFGMNKHYGRLSLSWRSLLSFKQYYLSNKN